MISKVYKVMQIDGDYAQLQDVNDESAEWKLVARALLPAEIYEGCMISYIISYSSIRDLGTGQNPWEQRTCGMNSQIWEDLYDGK